MAARPRDGKRPRALPRRRQAATRLARLEAFSREAANVAQVLATAARLGDHELVVTATRAVAARKPSFPMLLRLAVLRGGIAQSPELSELLVESELHRGVVDELHQLLARPVRDPNDWSIEHVLGCTCGDCAELVRFLRAPQQELDWPLAKERRKHVHRMLDTHELPVSHVTRRQGRPFVLQLRKHRSLFGREAKYYKALRTALGELEAARTAR